MGILLAFTPFFVYVVVELFAGVTAGLVAAAVVAAGLLLRDVLSHKGVKVLEAGAFLLFAGLAAYVRFTGVVWSIPAIRLRVDGGLLVVVLVSMAVRRPFTLQYAREKVAPELWNAPAFIRTNYIITAVWAAAFAVMVAADIALIHMPGMPIRRAVIITILALYGAARFTAWYPKRGRTGAAQSPD